ncbi:type II toxin-antitoxin system HipA family toxin [Cupriavidus sp. RAF12]|uniref:type II toxin-antitoxin system HipA family toxin n=1 Tax=Cupriavidus sp. RAF12 TaxID=3233050 RepID=UPI003F8F8EE0
MTRPTSLDVFYGDTRIGSLHDASPLAFEYAPTWLNRNDAFPLAAIPLAGGRQDSAAVLAFFENLLPEAELRQYIAEQRKASTLFSLLLEVAGDNAGAFVILPAGRAPAPAEYEATTWEALAARLGKTSAAVIDIAGRDARISLAGAQDKTSIAIFADGVPRLPRGTAPSTHILKPDIKRLAKVWHSAANEAIVMTIAAKCGLPTADVFYEPHTRSCVMRRFDRVLSGNGTLGRLIQYDLCQLAGTVSDRKYEKEGGPGIAQCAALIREYSMQPAIDLRDFVQWIFFNLYVGNNDSHAKNFSVYRHPQKGMVLTPFYDLMCTRLYPGLSREFAFSVGGETQPGNITREHVEKMAQSLGMQPRFVLGLAAELAKKMPVAVEEAVNTVTPNLSQGAKDLAERLAKFVVSTTGKVMGRLG